jgi:mannose-1-phosphate guanylyltransferase
MAGGVGNRLWPRSTEKTPKQFVHLTGEGTMIQNTLMRLLPIFPMEDIYVVTSESMKEYVYDQLPQIAKENVILEPFSKHTAPCLALTDIALKDKYEEDAVMMAFPADHLVYNVREFQYSVELAAETAYDKQGIVAIGVTPTRPEPDFGYVQVKNNPEGLGELFERGVKHCATFAEKPDVETAKRFIDSGDFLWNTGIFAWTLKTFRQQFEMHQPENDRLFGLIRKQKFSDLNMDEIEYIYRQIQAVSLDYAILEKADNVYVVEASFRWSDLGNWDELYRISVKDSRNNLIEGNVVAIDAANCFISSTDKFIGAVGVKDLIVIESEDAIMICHRGDSEGIKHVVDYLRRKQIVRYL